MGARVYCFSGEDASKKGEKENKKSLRWNEPRVVDFLEC